jgi:hypothetical protein
VYQPETIPFSLTNSSQVGSLHTLNYIMSPSAAISDYFLEVNYSTDLDQGMPNGQSTQKQKTMRQKGYG